MFHAHTAATNTQMCSSHSRTYARLNLLGRNKGSLSTDEGFRDCYRAGAARLACVSGICGRQKEVACLV